MWTFHNPHTYDTRFHQTPPTDEDRRVAREYLREKAERMRKLKVINVCDLANMYKDYDEIDEIIKENE